MRFSLTITLIGLLLLAPRAAAGEDAPSTETNTAEEAMARYRRGRELYEQKAWDQALAEFLASRKIHGTWKATSAAALSLKQLGRFDEALDMFETLLREYNGELSPDAKNEAQRQVVELRGRVGTIDIAAAEPGAAVTVDGQMRGEFPLLAPLRVSAGSHLVRVTKEGFEPFETRVDVASARMEIVTVHLRALVRSGRVRVAEQRGQTLDVLIDGGVVGKTPWEGPVSPGEHVIVLRGEGNLGTLPVPVTIAADQTAPLTLVAEELEAAMRVVPTPVNAIVVIDGVTVGRGIWEGRLRKGPHTIDIAAAGFIAASQSISLAVGKQEVFTVALQKDPSSPLWRKPARLFIEAVGSAFFAPTFGGDVAECPAPCDAHLAFGGKATLRGGYELGSGIGFGVTAGWLALGQSITNRATNLTPVGRAPRVATVKDDLDLRGMSVGGWAGFTFGEKYPVRVRVGAGAFFGSALDERSGSFVATDGKNYDLRPIRHAASTTFFWASPDVQVGWRFGEHLELSAGVSVLVLVALPQPTWDAEREINAATDGIGTYGAETLTGSAMVVAGPEVGLRYTF